MKKLYSNVYVAIRSGKLVVLNCKHDSLEEYKGYFEANPSRIAVGGIENNKTLSINKHRSIVRLWE